MHKRDIVLLCPGGANEGAFGGGVLTAFEEVNLYDRIRAVYGGSAGAVNLSFFMAHQTHFGSEIYTSGHLDRRFIRPYNVPIGIYQRFMNKYLVSRPLEQQAKAVDIDYLFDEVLSKKPLDIDRMHQTLEHIEYKILLGEVLSATAHFVDARHDTLTKLRAATALVPYYNRAVQVNRREYIDGTLIEPTGLPQVINELLPSDHLMVIMNYALTRDVRHYLKDYAESIVAGLMFKDAVAQALRDRVPKFKRDVGLMHALDRCTIIAPEQEYRVTPSTTNQNKLLRLYLHGLAKGHAVANQLWNASCQ